MNSHRPVIVALITLAITPIATAQIFKCDGPDGPIYTDRPCGPDATNVEVSDTSGLSGVSDETKAELAQRKADRDKDREADRRLKENRTVINNNFTTVNSEPSGRWLNYPYLRPKPERPQQPVVPPRSPPSTIGLRRK